jgi:hypothetical protein
MYTKVFFIVHRSCPFIFSRAFYHGRYTDLNLFALLQEKMRQQRKWMRCGAVLPQSARKNTQWPLRSLSTATLASSFHRSVSFFCVKYVSQYVFALVAFFRGVDKFLKILSKLASS